MAVQLSKDAKAVLAVLREQVDVMDPNRSFIDENTLAAALRRRSMPGWKLEAALTDLLRAKLVWNISESTGLKHWTLEAAGCVAEVL